MNGKGTLFALLIILVGLGLIFYTIYNEWMEFTGQLAIRRLEQEIELAEATAREAEADAKRMEGAADLANAQAAMAAAQAEVARADGEADARRSQALASAKVIEAGARTINRQSFMVLMWGALTPIGLLFTALCLLVAGGSTGALLVLGLLMLSSSGIVNLGNVGTRLTKAVD